MEKIKQINIDIYLNSKNQFINAGKIIFSSSEEKCSFLYNQEYIDNKLPSINPSTLNYSNGQHFIVDSKINSKMLDKTFWELIPSEEDWGHLVLCKKYPEYEYFNNVEKLYFLDNRVVGGLNSYINEKDKEENIVGLDWLDQVRDESIDFYMRRIEKITHIKAINPLSSYGGIRPKCMFEDDNGEHWIAKFNLPDDPFDFAIAEKIAIDMAKDLGLACAESKVVKLPSGENVFLSKRFDIQGSKKFHSLSLYSLIPEEKIKNKNGSVIYNLINSYSDFANQDTLDFVTKTIFDIGINNTDNHLKNFRLILNEQDKWHLSPFYDINFSVLTTPHIYSPLDLDSSEIFLANPSIIDLFSKKYNLPYETIEEKIIKIFNILENWEFYFNDLDVSEEDKEKIGNAIMFGLYRKKITQKNRSINKVSLKNNLKLTPNNQN